MNPNGRGRRHYDDGQAEARRLAAPRVHALRAAVVEAEWGDGYDDDLRDVFRRIDNILLWQCAVGEEIHPEVEEFVVGLLWVAALAKERAA